ncbi:MAG: hypothetical protein EHM84_02080 [Lysobacterales bacterium]|nr:MAG: hypothetical protein EHM84_02080 [Xanthomonadales bacterium]
MKHVSDESTKAGAPVDSALRQKRDAWVCGAATAVALFARWQMSPREALRQLGISRTFAKQCGVDAYEMEQLRAHWPRQVSGTKKKTRSRK